MFKDAVFLAFAYIECFAVPGIDQSIDIVAKLLADFVEESFDMVIATSRYE